MGKAQRIKENKRVRKVDAPEDLKDDEWKELANMMMEHCRINPKQTRPPALDLIFPIPEKFLLSADVDNAPRIAVTQVFQPFINVPIRTTEFFLAMIPTEANGPIKVEESMDSFVVYRLLSSVHEALVRYCWRRSNQIEGYKNIYFKSYRYELWDYIQNYLPSVLEQQVIEWFRKEFTFHRDINSIMELIEHIPMKWLTDANVKRFATHFPHTHTPYPAPEHAHIKYMEDCVRGVFEQQKAEWDSLVAHGTAASNDLMSDDFLTFVDEETNKTLDNQPMGKWTKWIDHERFFHYRMNRMTIEHAEERIIALFRHCCLSFTREQQKEFEMWYQLYAKPDETGVRNQLLSQPVLDPMRFNQMSAIKLMQMRVNLRRWRRKMIKTKQVKEALEVLDVEEAILDNKHMSEDIMHHCLREALTFAHVDLILSVVVNRMPYVKEHCFSLEKCRNLVAYDIQKAPPLVPVGTQQKEKSDKMEIVPDE